MRRVLWILGGMFLGYLGSVLIAVLLSQMLRVGPGGLTLTYLLGMGAGGYWGNSRARGLSSIEREASTEYVAQESTLAAFQTREADHWNEALLKYGQGASPGSQALTTIVLAGGRLRASGHKMLAYHSSIQFPNIAAQTYLRWEQVYNAYAAWADAQASAVEAIQEGYEPSVSYVGALLGESETCRKQAEKHERRLLSLIGLRPDEVRLFLRPRESELDDWTPP